MVHQDEWVENEMKFESSAMLWISVVLSNVISKRAENEISVEIIILSNYIGNFSLQIES